MISTHILDTTKGIPAEQVFVTLERNKGQSWELVAKVATNSDGRIAFDCDKIAGTYRLTFAISEYFARTKTPSFFADVPIAFIIEDTQRKYHVPLLLNPFGFSTYRGS